MLEQQIQQHGVFKRPDDEIMSKYNLANSYDERFGGNLSHVVVMQHVKKEVIDKFIAELEGTMTSTVNVCVSK